jgi:hypothetical protein
MDRVRISIEGVDIRTIDFDWLINEGLAVFLCYRDEHHTKHGRETCFQETIEELRRQRADAETDTRRSPGS